MLHMFIAGSPERQAWLAGLGQRLHKDGYLWAAEWALATVVAHGEPSATLYYELGKSQVGRGHLDAARESLIESLALNPNFYLCRKLLSDLCRRQYWEEGTPHPDALPIAPPPELVEAHQRIREAAFPELLMELVRTDDDLLDDAITDRFRARLDRGDDDRSRRALRQRLDACLSTLAVASDAMTASAQPTDSHRRANVHTKQGAELHLIGLHDADDVIGYHLEVIVDHRLTFLPFAAMEAIHFGRRSDYLRGEVEIKGGSRLEVAIPLSYYGSHRSPLNDVRSGEMTILQPLIDGMNVGLGRRSFMGKDAQTGQMQAVGIQEISRVDFDCDWI